MDEVVHVHAAVGGERGSDLILGRCRTELDTKVAAGPNAS